MSKVADARSKQHEKRANPSGVKSSPAKKQRHFDDEDGVVQKMVVERSHNGDAHGQASLESLIGGAELNAIAMRADFESALSLVHNMMHAATSPYEAVHLPDRHKPVANESIFSELGRSLLPVAGGRGKSSVFSSLIMTAVQRRSGRELPVDEESLFGDIGRAVLTDAQHAAATSGKAALSSLLSSALNNVAHESIFGDLGRVLVAEAKKAATAGGKAAVKTVLGSVQRSISNESVFGDLGRALMKETRKIAVPVGKAALASLLTSAEAHLAQESAYPANESAYRIVGRKRDTLKALLASTQAHGASVESVFPDLGGTAFSELEHAALAGNKTQVKRLLAAGHDVSGLALAVASNSVVRQLLRSNVSNEAPMMEEPDAQIVAAWQTAVMTAVGASKAYQSGNADAGARILGGLAEQLPALETKTNETVTKCENLSNEAQKTVAGLMAKRGDLEHTLSSVNSQIAGHSAELNQIQSTVGEMQQQVARATISFHHAERELREAKDKVAKKKSVTDVLRWIPIPIVQMGNLAYQGLDELINRTEARMRDATGTLQQVSGRMNELVRRRDEMQRTIGNLQAQLSGLQGQLPALTSSIQRLQVQVGNIKALISVFNQAKNFWTRLSELVSAGGSVESTTNLSKEILNDASAGLPDLMADDGTKITLGNLQSSWHDVSELMTNADAFADIDTLSARLAAAIGNIPVPAVTASGNVSDQVVKGGNWNSGAFAPGWIELDFGQPTAMDRISLTVDQVPNGGTSHTLLGGNSSPPTTLLKEFTGETKKDDRLVWDFTPGSYRYLRIVTTASPSWVAWSDIIASNTRARAGLKSLNESVYNGDTAMEGVVDGKFVPDKVSYSDDDDPKGDKELYSIVELPKPTSKCVDGKIKDLLVEINLDQLVTSLGQLSGFIEVALTGTRGFSKLYISITTIGYSALKTTDRAALTIRKFRDASTTVSTNLKAAYAYLVSGREKIAISHIAATRNLATTMAKTANDLSDEFQSLSKTVQDAQINVMQERAGQEAAIEKAKADQEKYENEKELALKASEAAKKAEQRAQLLYEEAKSAEQEANKRAFILGIVGAVTGAVTGGITAIAKVAGPLAGAGIGASMGIPPQIGAAAGGALTANLGTGTSPTATTTATVPTATATPPQPPVAEPTKPGETDAQRKAREARNDKALADFNLAMKDFKDSLNKVGDQQMQVAKQAMSEKQTALQRVWDMQDKQQEALMELAKAAQLLSSAAKTQKVSEAAAAALGAAVGALKQLSSLMGISAKFWQSLADHCTALADKTFVDTLQESIQDQDLDSRRELYNSDTFQREALEYYVGWLSLRVICEKYVDIAVKSSVHMDEVMKANPDVDSASKDIAGLAEKFLSDLTGQMNNLSKLKDETAAALKK